VATNLESTLGGGTERCGLPGLNQKSVRPLESLKSSTSAVRYDEYQRVRLYLVWLFSKRNRICYPAGLMLSCKAEVEEGCEKPPG